MSGNEHSTNGTGWNNGKREIVSGVIWILGLITVVIFLYYGLSSGISALPRFSRATFYLLMVGFFLGAVSLYTIAPYLLPDNDQAEDGS